MRFRADGIESSNSISFESCKLGWSIVMLRSKSSCRSTERSSPSIDYVVHVHEHVIVHLKVGIWGKNALARVFTREFSSFTRSRMFVGWP